MPRGRTPTPTVILRHRGSWRANNRPDEPSFQPITPECPAWLTGVAAEEFNRVARLLGNARVLSAVDVAAVAQYAFWFAESLAAGKDIKRAGRASTLLLKWSQELGLTPASRARVRALDTSGNDCQKSRFFTGPMRLTIAD